LSVSGNTTLGDVATDTVTFTADIASNVIPSADNTYDLGSSSAEWKDLYIDGAAYIDTLKPNFIRIDDAPNKIVFGDDGDLEIYHEPDAGGFIDCTLDNNIDNRALYIFAEPFIVDHTNVEVLKTTSTGITVTGISVTAPSVPASATATGTAGDIAWDADYIYVCTATNTWKRVAISTWT
jgi:hypothetical protein